jgi:hypothetical protein
MSVELCGNPWAPEIISRNEQKHTDGQYLLILLIFLRCLLPEHLD